MSDRAQDAMPTPDKGLNDRFSSFGKQPLEWRRPPGFSKLLAWALAGPLNPVILAILAVVYASSSEKYDTFWQDFDALLRVVIVPATLASSIVIARLHDEALTLKRLSKSAIFWALCMIPIYGALLFGYFGATQHVDAGVVPAFLMGFAASIWGALFALAFGWVVLVWVIPMVIIGLVAIRVMALKRVLLSSQ